LAPTAKAHGVAVGEAAAAADNTTMGGPVRRFLHRFEERLGLSTIPGPAAVRGVVHRLVRSCV